MKYKIKDLLFILIVIISIFLYNNIPSQEVQLRENNINNPISKENFSIHFLDVGEADSILINSNNEYMLIDSGNYADRFKLIDYFDNLNIKEFKYVIGTHAHEDHIGGMAIIINKYQVDRFFMPDVMVNTKCYEYLIKALDNKNILYETPSIDSEYTLNDTKIKVINISNKEEDLNDTSIILKIIYKNNSFLLTGDASKNIELNILDKDIESDVLKISHHGSKYATSAQFLKKVNPKYAVISVGENNEYYHPHQITLDKLDRLNIKTYRTDLNGNIILYSDGNNIYFKTER